MYEDDYKLLTCRYSFNLSPSTRTFVRKRNVKKIVGDDDDTKLLNTKPLRAGSSPFFCNIKTISIQQENHLNIQYSFLILIHSTFFFFFLVSCVLYIVMRCSVAVKLDDDHPVGNELLNSSDAFLRLFRIVAEFWTARSISNNSVIYTFFFNRNVTAAIYYQECKL